ncbi:MAG: hypothetical protein QOJ99_4065 [Bryobacterales bacterium]|jgi:hypothetical protein|nr:hypothetical protein [Bryobacterales bacterium]
MKSLFYVTGVVALVGVSLLMASVKTDYDHSADFKSYKTYSWIKVDAGNPLWIDRIQQAVDQQMSTKGLTKQDSGADLGVAALGRTKKEQTYNTFYDGIGGGWGWRGFGNMGMGTATTTVSEQPVGTLTVDMFDAKSKKLVWRGIATETLSDKPEKNEKKLQKEVADMFKKFPPKGES